MDRRAGARAWRSPSRPASVPAACMLWFRPVTTPLGAHFGAVRVFGTVPGTHHGGGDGTRRRHSGAGRGGAGAHARGWAARCWCPTTRPIPSPSAPSPSRRRALSPGRAELLGRPAVAVVGSRDHTPTARTWRAASPGRAAAGGVVVVSGMARGLDAVAHHARARCGRRHHRRAGQRSGRRLSGANRRLYERMAERGPAADRVSARRAPPRRQLSPAQPAHQRAGSGHGGGRGGRRARARSSPPDAALEQGREVMAVPGPDHQPRSRSGPTG